MSVSNIDQTTPGVREFIIKPVSVRAIEFKYPPTKELLDFLSDRVVNVIKVRHPKALAELHTVTTWIDKNHSNSQQTNLLAIEGDWIIQGENGEFFSCKPDVFEKTYQLVT